MCSSDLGHIMLSRKVAMRNHYPAIDVLGSISRLMSQIIEPEHKKVANEIRKIMSVYQENQDLISIGAYKAGSNPDLDYAISKIKSINSFLQQPVDAGEHFEDTVELLKEILND